MNMKLHQLLALETGTNGLRSRTTEALTTIYRQLQQVAQFNGRLRTYRPYEDKPEEQLPEESTRVTARAGDLLTRMEHLMVAEWNIMFSRDEANQRARADVVLDGNVIIKDAPATFLLSMEKKLKDLKAELEKVPTFDPGHDWKYDAAVDLFKAAPIAKQRTRKVQKPIVLYPATDKHPAQTQLVSEDIPVGEWTEVQLSGALSPARKTQLLARVGKLIDAFTLAREKANQVDVIEASVAGRIFNYLFSA